jgi:hypothetical protein
MAEASKDTGVVLALIEHFETQRLSRALEIMDRIDRGQFLSELDMAFLKQVFEDAQHVKALAHKHPEWQPMVARAFTLYREVTENALVIEKAAGSDKR